MSKKWPTLFVNAFLSFFLLHRIKAISGIAPQEILFGGVYQENYNYYPYTV